MTYYVVETIGANACSNFVSIKGRQYRSDNVRTLEPQVVVDNATGLPALFATADKARAVGLAIRWNNQRIRVRRARKADREAEP